jgi:hypothetical protein
MKRETVKRRESVALQTFLTSDEIGFSVVSLIGMSCMTAATIANGPGRKCKHDKLASRTIKPTQKGKDELFLQA